MYSRTIHTLLLGMLAVIVQAENTFACTRSPYPSSRAPIYFIGLPLPHRVDTGPNPFPCTKGHLPSPNCPSQIHGQEIRILRLGGSQTSTVLPALKRHHNIAIVVPWDDDPACERVTWTRPSFPWRVGARGVFVAKLRPEGRWTEGKPTFDIQPAFLEPYPYGALFDLGSQDSKQKRGRALSVDEYWELYETLPEPPALTANPCEAFAPIKTWLKKHPLLARQYPVPEVIDSVKWAINFPREGCPQVNG